MTHRFYSDAPISSERASLTGSEAHHLTHVLRAKAGTEVVLFDGSGAEFSALVVEVGRGSVDLQVLSQSQASRELPFPLTLGVALPKGERQRWLVEKAVELGVRRLVPLYTVRGVAQPAEQALARLRRVVVEASKQCGRNRLMDVAEPRQLADYLGDVPADACRLVAHPAANETFSRADVFASNHDVSSPVCLAVGPEGGFCSEEICMARAAGWPVVSLGPRIMRVETAALALAAAVALGRVVEGAE